MTSIPIQIKQEIAIFEWRDNQVYCQDYDLENEKIALFLASNLGQGMGVFYVALSQMCQSAKNEDKMRVLCSNFNEDYAEFEVLGSLEYLHNYSSLMLMPYMAYSPLATERSEVAREGNLCAPIWKNLLNDRESRVRIDALENNQSWQHINDSLSDKLLRYEEERINEILAQIPFLNQKIYIELAKSPNLEVLENLAYNESCPHDIALFLASTGIDSVALGLLSHNYLRKDVCRRIISKRSIPSCSELLSLCADRFVAKTLPARNYRTLQELTTKQKETNLEL